MLLCKPVVTMDSRCPCLCHAPIPYSYNVSEQSDGHRRYFLAKNPKSMAKLEAELDAAGLLVTDGCPRPRAFTYSDISKLRFLDCVIRVRPNTAQNLIAINSSVSYIQGARSVSICHEPLEGILDL